jgi:hypothetical protein
MYRLIVLGWLVACQRADNITTTIRLATDEYVVLAEKALTYQADGDWEAWADMLADSVVYYAPNRSQPLVGKAAVLIYCQDSTARPPVQLLWLEGFLHIPVQHTSPQAEAGVYVVSLYRAQCRLAAGRSTLRYNVCSHFDAAKRIDRLEVYQSPWSGTAARF